MARGRVVFPQEAARRLRSGHPHGSAARDRAVANQEMSVRESAGEAAHGASAGRSSDERLPLGTSRDGMRGGVRGADVVRKVATRSVPKPQAKIVTQPENRYALSLRITP